MPRAIASRYSAAFEVVAHDRVDDDAVEDVVGGGVEAARAGQAEQLGGDAGLAAARLGVGEGEHAVAFDPVALAVGDVAARAASCWRPDSPSIIVGDGP